MLFNLSQERNFPNKGTGKVIVCGNSGFGFGEDELIVYQPFNGDKKCRSFENN
jgi:hypothetical protein